MNTTQEVRIFQPSLNQEEFLLVIDGLNLIAAAANAGRNPYAVQIAVSVALDQFEKNGVEGWKKLTDRLLEMCKPSQV